MRRSSKPPLHRGPLVLLGDGLVLFFLLTGTLFSFLSAFSVEVLGHLLLLACAACTLLFLLIWSLPRRWWLPPLGVLSTLWALAVWRLWHVLTLGEVSLRCDVFNAFISVLELGERIMPIAELPAEAWPVCVTLLLAFALFPLGALLGLAVVRLRRFWLQLCLSAPFLLAPLCISITPAWPPLMALLLAWLVSSLSSLAGKKDGQGAARLNLIVLPAGALLLSILTLAMPQERYQRPAWADKANDTLTNWAVHMSDALFDGNGPFGGRWGTGSGLLARADGTVPLSNAGPLSFSGRTVLDVRTSLRGRIYLRGFSGAVYDGTSWSPLEASSYAPLESLGPGSVEFTASSVPGLNLLQGYLPMNFPALAERESFPDHTYAKVTIRNLGADPGYVYYPYHILTQPEELSGAEFVHDAYLARQEGEIWTHTLYVQPGCSPASGAELTGTARTAERVYAEFAASSYTDIPTALLPVLAEQWRLLGEQAALPAPLSQDQRLAYAELVRDYLATHAEYDPDTPVTPEG